MLLLNIIGQKYQVIAVGIIKAITGTQIPDDKMAVYIFSVEECASNYLQTGQVILWPKCLLMNPPSAKKNDIPEKKEEKKPGIYLSTYAYTS